jgi:hypothetical protein
MTSMSVDFKAIREVGNRLYPISMTTPWVTIKVREVNPVNEPPKGFSEGIQMRNKTCGTKHIIQSRMVVERHIRGIH